MCLRSYGVILFCFAYSSVDRLWFASSWMAYRIVRTIPNTNYKMNLGFYGKIHFFYNNNNNNNNNNKIIIIIIIIIINSTIS